MDSNQRAASDRRVWLYSLEVEVMAVMVLLEASGETATYQYLEKWRERLATERRLIAPADARGEDRVGERHPLQGRSICPGSTMPREDEGIANSKRTDLEPLRSHAC